MTFGYFFWCYKDVVGAERRAAVGGDASALVSGQPLGCDRRHLHRHRDVLEADPRPARSPRCCASAVLRAAVAADAAHRRVLHAGGAGCCSAPTSRSRASGTTRAAIGGPSTAAWAGSRSRPSDNQFDAVGDDRTTNSVPLEVLDRTRRVRRRVPPQPRLLRLRTPHRLRRLLLPGRDGDRCCSWPRRAIARCGSG